MSDFEKTFVSDSAGATVDPATKENQTNGTQRTRITDDLGFDVDVRDGNSDNGNNANYGLTTNNRLYGYDAVGNNWDRLRTTNSGDGLNTGIFGTGLYAWNGASMDRLRSSLTHGLEVDVTRLLLNGTEISEANPTPTLTGSEKWESLKTLTAYGPGLAYTVNNDSPLTTVYEYHGIATRGTATSATTWDVMRMEFTNVDKEVIVQILVNEDMAWDDRVTGGTQGWTA